MNITTDSVARGDLLASIAAATVTYGPDEVDVFAIANALGRIAPHLLGSPRERLLTALRVEGFIARRRVGNRTIWFLTPTGSALLAQRPPTDRERS